MEKEQAEANIQNCVKRCRRVARTALIIITSFWLLFALFSGAEVNGGGFNGLVENLPNTLPWLGLLILCFIAWRWELIGGLLIIAASVFFAFFFGAFEGNATRALMIITPLTMTGFMFIFIWYRIWVARKSL